MRSSQKQADVRVVAATVVRTGAPDAFPSPEELTACRRLASSETQEFAAFLAHLRCGDVDAARRLLPDGTDVALDREHLITRDPKIDPTRDDALAAMTRDTLALVGREPVMTAGMDLVRLSLTVPNRFNGSVRLVASRYARESAERATGRGVLLATDRRKDTSEHLHGIVLTNDKADDVGRWCEMTGASEKGCLRDVITGWREYRAGDARLIVENLPRLLKYSAKPWPGEADRRASDVFASGTLAPLRDALVALAVPSGVATLPDAPTGQAERGETLQGCAGCGRELRGMRSDAVWCSGRCRVAACRARARGERS